MDIQRELRVVLLHVEVIQASDESASWAPYRLVQQAGDLRADLELAGGIIYHGNTLGSTNAGLQCWEGGTWNPLLYVLAVPPDPG